MRWAIIRSSLDNKFKVILNDKLFHRLRTVTRRNYSEKPAVREQYGYRSRAAGGTQEVTDRGYLILIFPLTTFFLGVWQVKRQKWKTDLKKFLSSRYEEEPVALPEKLDGFDFSELEYKRIKVRGHFEYDKQIYLGPRTGPVPAADQNFGIGEHKAPGFYVVTPFRLEGRNYSIMVNRGFLPERIMNEKTLKESQVHGTHELIGILRFDQDTRYVKYLVSGDLAKPQQKDGRTNFMVRQVNVMAQHCDTAPIYMECLPKNFKQFTPTITATTNVELRDDHTMYAIICSFRKGQLQTFAPTITATTNVELRDDHTMYAIIWFSLTAITLYMWYNAYKGKTSSLLIYQTMERQKNFKRNPRIK